LDGTVLACRASQFFRTTEPTDSRVALSAILIEPGESMRAERVVAALFLLAVPAVSFAVADDTTLLPEPETLALFAGAGVAWAIVHWLKRK